MQLCVKENDFETVLNNCHLNRLSKSFLNPCPSDVEPLLRMTIQSCLLHVDDLYSAEHGIQQLLGFKNRVFRLMIQGPDAAFGQLYVAASILHQIDSHNITLIDYESFAEENACDFFALKVRDFLFQLRTESSHLPVIYFPNFNCILKKSPKSLQSMIVLFFMNLQSIVCKRGCLVLATSSEPWTLSHFGTDFPSVFKFFGSNVEACKFSHLVCFDFSVSLIRPFGEHFLKTTSVVVEWIRNEHR